MPTLLEMIVNTNPTNENYRFQAYNDINGDYVAVTCLRTNKTFATFSGPTNQSTGEWKLPEFSDKLVTFRANFPNTFADLAEDVPFNNDDFEQDRLNKVLATAEEFWEKYVAIANKPLLTVFIIQEIVDHGHRTETFTIEVFKDLEKAEAKVKALINQKCRHPLAQVIGFAPQERFADCIKFKWAYELSNEEQPYVITEYYIK